MPASGRGRLQIPFDLREEQREGDRIYVTSSRLGGGNRFITSRLRVSLPSSVPDLFSYHTRGGSGVAWSGDACVALARGSRCSWEQDEGDASVPTPPHPNPRPYGYEGA